MLGAAAGVCGSAGYTVGQANRGFRPISYNGRQRLLYRGVADYYRSGQNLAATLSWCERQVCGGVSWGGGFQKESQQAGSLR
jgi:outer membrane protease